MREFASLTQTQLSDASSYVQSDSVTVCPGTAEINKSQIISRPRK